MRKSSVRADERDIVVEHSDVVVEERGSDRREDSAIQELEVVGVSDHNEVQQSVENELLQLLSPTNLSGLIAGLGDPDPLITTPIPPMNLSQHVEEVASESSEIVPQRSRPLKRTSRLSLYGNKKKKSVTFEDDGSDFISDDSMSGFTLIERCLSRTQNPKP